MFKLWAVGLERPRPAAPPVFHAPCLSLMAVLTSTPSPSREARGAKTTGWSHSLPHPEQSVQWPGFQKRPMAPAPNPPTWLNMLKVPFPCQDLKPLGSLNPSLLALDTAPSASGCWLLCCASLVLGSKALALLTSCFHRKQRCPQKR